MSHSQSWCRVDATCAGVVSDIGVEVSGVAMFVIDTACATTESQGWIQDRAVRVGFKQEAQLMLTIGSTRLAVSRGQQTWYHSTCYI